MRFYEKQFENNFEELITYYPRFYRDVYEMVEILKANGRVFDRMEGDIEQTYLNCFIEYADEETIKKLEDFLDIRLNKSRTLEERRRLVKSYFIGFGKVSATMLKEMIQSYTGAEVECKFEPFDEAGNNMLYLNFQRGKEPTLYMSDINLLLSKKIPAHIKWRAAVTYRFPIGIGKRRTHYPCSYEFCGTKPEPVLVASAHGIETATAPGATNAVMTYKNSSEGGVTPEAGTTPNISTLAHNDAINAAGGSAMAFWTDVFLNKVRQDWLKRIVKIQYYAGGVWYDAMITNKTIEGDTLKITSQTTDSKALVVTSVRLIDTGGDVAGQISESITKLDTQGVITLWEFPLYEITSTQ